MSIETSDLYDPDISPASLFARLADARYDVEIAFLAVKDTLPKDVYDRVHWLAQHDGTQARIAFAVVQHLYTPAPETCALNAAIARYKAAERALDEYDPA